MLRVLTSKHYKELGGTEKPFLSRMTKVIIPLEKWNDGIELQFAELLFEELGTQFCDDYNCNVLEHTRIIDSRTSIILEPKACCCRTLLASITKVEKLSNHSRQVSAILEPVDWNCTELTVETFLSSCCPPRNSTNIEIDIAQKIVMIAAVVGASWMMLVKDALTAEDTTYQLPQPTVEQVAIGCVLESVSRLPLNLFYPHDPCWFSSNDLVRDIIPLSIYTRAALAWAAYEMSTGNSEMSILVRNPYTSNGEFALHRLVAILNRDGLAKKIARFRTDDSAIAYDLVHTFAKKIFNAYLPLQECVVDLPRVWDMHENRLVPYKAHTATVGFISHSWTKHEVTYGDCSMGTVLMNDKLSSIKRQLRPVCRFWWMDTLCINKSDMAELDMSIRSMHKWYSAASIVAVPTEQDILEWMSRGWCLQEGKAARAILLNASRLPEGGDKMLTKLLEMGCVSTDMPASLWLSLMTSRYTTRVEDKAYALIGLLKLDFQIMYGEGERSWPRLIEQLAIQRGDLSWMMGQGHECWYDSQCFIPGIIRPDYIAKHVSNRPIRLSHLGMELYVAAIDKSSTQVCQTWMAKVFPARRRYGIKDTRFENTKMMIVSGTNVILAVDYKDVDFGEIILAVLAHDIKPVGKAEPHWLTRRT